MGSVWQCIVGTGRERHLEEGGGLGSGVVRRGVLHEGCHCAVWRLYLGTITELGLLPHDIPYLL